MSNQFLIGCLVGVFVGASTGWSCAEMLKKWRRRS